MTQTLWQSYVEFLAHEHTQSDVAEVTGVDQATVSRWRRGTGKKSPDPGSVAAFCRGYGRSPLEGFVAAGMLKDDDARRGLPPESFAVLDSLRAMADQEPVDEAYAAVRRELLGTEPGPSRRRRRKDLTG